MTGICAAVQQSAGFVGYMTRAIDCQAQNFGIGGWSALAAPGSTLQAVVTGFLTIFVALIGYRLLLGLSLTVRETTLVFVKIGAVLALTTNWAAYQPLVYSVVTDGPGQLVAEIGPRAGVAGSDGTLTQRLDLADRDLQRLAIVGTGDRQVDDSAQGPQSSATFDSFALGGSRVLFLLSAVAGLGIVRIVCALMLAVGPFFIAFVLFDSTRSLFEGWVRVLAGAGFASFGVSIALGLGLDLMESFLRPVLAQRLAGDSLPAAPAELLAASSFFGVTIAIVVYLSMRVTKAFRLGRFAWFHVASPGSDQPVRTALPSPAPGGRPLAQAGRGRAAGIVAGFSRPSWRESSGALESLATDQMRQSPPKMATVDRSRPGHSLPLGKSFTSRSQRRVSAMATRRDAGA